jgi:hypothetical protein
MSRTSPRPAPYTLLLLLLVYRYDRYVEDAKAEGCQQCVQLWQRLKQRDEEDLNELMQHFKAHIDSGMVEFSTGQMKKAA